MVFADSTCLPADYCPPSNVAVLGRGKRYINHPGNRRLRELVLAELPTYNAITTTRKTKSATILRVIETMRNGTEGQIGFVRYDTLTGNLFLVDDGTARVCVAQTFRDCLSKNYRSSKQFKRKKRQEIKEKSSDTTMTCPPPPPQVVSPSTFDEDQAQEDLLKVTSAAEEGANVAPSPSGAWTEQTGVSMFLSSLLAKQGANQPKDTAPGTNGTSGRHGLLWLDSVASSGCIPAAQSPVNSILPGPAAPQESSVDGRQEAAFHSLFDAFAADSAVPTEDNPFEPRPIVSSSSSQSDLALQRLRMFV